MGFTTGFTGGVTLTLSLAYLTVLAHQRNRERQSAMLRAQTDLISGMTDPLPPVHPPSRSELAFRERQNLIETAKDRWNAEVEGAARWVQTKDWEGVRVGAESAVENLWSRAFADGKAAEVKDAAQAGAGSVAAASQNAYAEAKARGADAVALGEKKADEAKSSVFGAIGSGLKKGKEALSMARAKVVSAEEKVEAKVDAKLDEALSPVERTLRQRYEGPRWTDKTPEEILADRYTPMDQRPEAELRGV